MPEFCHRCGEEINANREQTFCPACGLPQLFLAEELLPVEGETHEVSAAAEGRPSRSRDVEWQTALRCAALVAGTGVILALASVRIPSISALSSLWLLSGSVIALGLYQRRRPAARMDARIGARIGAAFGVLTIAAGAVVLAAAGLVARFGLRNMAGFDARLTQWMGEQIRHAVTTNNFPPEVAKGLLAPEFQTGFVLFELGFGAAFLLLFSTAGGIVAGLLRTRRPRA